VQMMQFAWIMMATSLVLATLDTLEMESHVMVGQCFCVQKCVSLKQYHRVSVFVTDNMHILQILMSALEQMIVTLMQTV